MITVDKNHPLAPGLNFMRLVEHKAVVDPRFFAAFPTDTLISTPSNNFVILSSPLLATNAEFLQNLLKLSDKMRINLFSPDLAVIFDRVPEVSSGGYSWFVFFGPLNNLSAKKMGDSFVKETLTSTLTPDEKHELAISWRRDYIDSLLRSQTDSVKLAQEKSLSERLSEGVHALYRFEKKIVGHGCWVNDFHEVLNTPCSYWHQWLDPRLPKELRQSVHSQFFTHLYSQTLQPMSGVAISNSRALGHCIRNEMSPVMLSIRREGTHG